MDDVGYFGSGRLQVRRVALSFGRVRVGRRARRDLIVRNLAERPDDILWVRPETAPPFFVSHDTDHIAILPGQFLRLWVRFNPDIRGAAAGTLVLTASETENQEVEIKLRGRGG